MRFIIKIFARLAILLTAVMILYLFRTLILFALVPWDTSLIRPDIGTWQRTVNDFFEGRFGENLVLLFFSFTAAYPVIKMLMQPRKILLRGLLVNILCLFLMFASFIIGSELKFIVFPYSTDYSDPFFHNYTRSLIPLTIYSVIYCGWLSQLMKLSKPVEKQKRKAKNTLETRSTYRLTAQMPDYSHAIDQDNHVQSGHFASQ